MSLEIPQTDQWPYEHLKAILDNSADLIWSVDRNYNLVYSNLQFDKTVKYLSGRTISPGNSVLGEGFSDEQNERWRSRYDKAVKGEVIKDIEYTVTPEELWTEVCLSPIWKDGMVDSLACFAHNITEQKGNERKLENSGKRLKQTQQLALLGNWELDFTTGVSTWSDEACRIYGLSTENNRHTYNEWLSFVHKDDKEYVSGIATENPLEGFSIFHRIVCPDGTVKHVHAVTNPEFGEDGKPTGLYGIVHDITEVKEAEAALTLSEANLKKIIDLIPESIHVKDEDGTYVFANRHFAEIFGLTPNEIVNRNIRDLYPPKNVKELLGQDQEIFTTGKTLTYPDVTVTTPSGEERCLYVIKMPYTPPQTQKPAVLSIFLDITEQRQGELEKNKMIADIMSHSNDLERFSYMVSHVLRSPVANILGLATIVHDLEPGSEDKKEILNAIGESAAKLDEVVKDLNETLESGQSTSETKEMVRFKEIMDIVKTCIGRTSKPQYADIITDFSTAPAMPAFKRGLFSVFYNLIRHCLDHQRPIIRISSKKQNDVISLAFRSYSATPPTAQYDDKEFKMLHSLPHDVEGDGIGLYVVKIWVPSMGGKMDINDIENGGIEFRIEFDVKNTH